MSHAVNVGSGDRAVVSTRPADHAYWLLHVGFAALPIIAGLDKFFHRLANWDMYLAPRVTQFVAQYTGLTDHKFMMIVGVVEIVAGLLVAVAPRLGGWVVALWLWGIIANLLMMPPGEMQFYDIALRDFGLSLGAIALARLAADPARRTSIGW
jgi:uncharacterized membrane protein YphA (DoxX/SURF4 family)